MISEAKEELLKAIVDLEMDFFKNMKKQEEVDEKALPALRKMRWMTYSCLSDKTLLLLLQSLCTAQDEGRNTMIEKYALIDGLIPTIQKNPIIPKIVDQEIVWMDEVAKKYPKTVQGHEDNKDLFKKYMLCELQSWTPEALESYFKDVKNAKENGINLAEIRYDNLYESLGKGSLKEFNSTL